MQDDAGEDARAPILLLDGKEGLASPAVLKVHVAQGECDQGKDQHQAVGHELFGLGEAVSEKDQQDGKDDVGDIPLEDHPNGT